MFDSFFSLENRAVYEIMCKNSVERSRPQMKIWHMRIAWWMSRATKYTLGVCNTYCFSTVTMAVQTRLSAALYAEYIASVVQTLSDGKRRLCHNLPRYASFWEISDSNQVRDFGIWYKVISSDEGVCTFLNSSRQRTWPCSRPQSLPINVFCQTIYFWFCLVFILGILFWRCFLLDTLICLFFLLFSSTGLTVCYSFRLFYFVLCGDFNFVSSYSMVETSYNMVFGMIALLIISIFGGSSLMWLIFIYGLLNDAVSSWDYITVNDRKITD